MLALEEKTTSKLGSILKTRDITLPTKSLIVILWFFSSYEELMILNCGGKEDS